MAAITTTPAFSEKKTASIDSIIDEKLPLDENESGELHPDGLVDLKAAALSDDVGDVYDNVRAIDLGADGRERPIGTQSACYNVYSAHHATETDADYAIRLISLEDDPTLPIFTLRMWFLSLGLSCFGAVLGQIFVGFLHDYISCNY